MTVFEKIRANQHSLSTHPLADPILLSRARRLNEIGQRDERKCAWWSGIVDGNSPAHEIWILTWGQVLKRGQDRNGASGEHQPPVFDLRVDAPEFLSYPESHAAVELPVRRWLFEYLITDEIVRVGGEIDEAELIKRSCKHVHGNRPLLLSGRHFIHEPANYRHGRGSLVNRRHQDRIVFRLPFTDADNKKVVEAQHLRASLRRRTNRFRVVRMPEHHELFEMIERFIVDGDNDDVGGGNFPAHQEVQVSCLQVERVKEWDFTQQQCCDHAAQRYRRDDSPAPELARGRLVPKHGASLLGYHHGLIRWRERALGAPEVWEISLPQLPR